MNLFVFSGLFLAVISFGLSIVLTAITRGLAVRVGFAAHPQSDRYHQSVVALGGGIAIFWTLTLILLGTLAIIYLKKEDIGQLFPILQPHLEGFLTKKKDLLIVLGCAFFLHLIGLWDDQKPLGPLFKLAIQFLAAATAAALADIRLEFFIQNRFLTILLSVLWIVILINAFNFLDNMDGVSAGIAAIVSAVLLTAAVRSGQIFI